MTPIPSPSALAATSLPLDGELPGYGHVLAVAFEPSSSSVISGLLHKVAELTWYVRWDREAGLGRVIARPQPGRPGRIGFLAGGCVLTATWRQAVSAPSVRVWSPDMSAVQHEVAGRLLHLDASTGQGWLAVGGQVERWDLLAGARLDVLESPSVRAALEGAFRPRTVAGGARPVVVAAPGAACIAVVDLMTGAELLSRDVGFEISRLVVAPALPWVAVTGFDGEVVAYELTSGEEAARLAWPEERVAESVAFHPVAPWLCIPHESGGLTLQDLATGEAVQRWPADPDPNSGPIDVLHVIHAAAGTRVAAAHMNQRLLVAEVGQPGWRSAWEGVEPITACAANGAGLIVCGDQSGAVTFLQL